MNNKEIIKELNNSVTWEEKSGFLNFLSNTPKEVKRFNDTFGFHIRNIVSPLTIDEKKENLRNLAFLYIRNNPLMPEREYCLYSLLKEHYLYGYIGLYKNGGITTIRELDLVKNYKKASLVLYNWLRELVKASCEKY